MVIDPSSFIHPATEAATELSQRFLPISGAAWSPDSQDVASECAAAPEYAVRFAAGSFACAGSVARARISYKF
jgi:hypothetical protein